MSAVDPTEPRVEIPCPFCSEPILNSAKKCKHCGEWLEQPSPTVPAATASHTGQPGHCKKCGQVTPRSTGICKRCEQAEPTPERTIQRSPSQRRPPLAGLQPKGIGKAGWIGIGVAGFVVMGLLLAMTEGVSGGRNSWEGVYESRFDGSRLNIRGSHVTISNNLGTCNGTLPRVPGGTDWQTTVDMACSDGGGGSVELKPCGTGFCFYVDGKPYMRERPEY